MAYIAADLKIGNSQIQTPQGIPSGGTGSLEKILSVGITLFLIIVIIAALIYLIWGGINWIMSGGDKEGIAKARAKITYAIIGLVIALASFFIISIIGNMFGVELVGAP